MVKTSALAAVLLVVIGTSSVASAHISPAGDDGAHFASLIRREAARVGLPFEIADAVVAVESGYDPTRVGSVGEIGLMQVRPQTAAMLGFTGTVDELAAPAVNIHLGVAYLAQAWGMAHQDLCRTLMKYRAGLGEESMSARSAEYCRRARNHMGLPGEETPVRSAAAAPTAPALQPSPTFRSRTAALPSLRGLHGAAFWAVQNARVRMISAQVERRWRREASLR